MARFSWEHRFGFYVAGMVGHDFLKNLRRDVQFSRHEDPSAEIRGFCINGKAPSRKGRRPVAAYLVNFRVRGVQALP
jgi:hypothetical protein